tara:strand:+ start:508 stop:1212 length:705 start_codon:yes stop_codon:yes gene_type:complete
MYGKLFAQMYDGTLATKGPWEALVTFQQLIVLADKHGHVDMTAEAVARRTTIPLPIIETGIATLLMPDTQSRSPDECGRRIVPISEGRDWGWRIVNYDHYRKIRSEEERREYHKQYMRARREPVNQNVKVSTGGDQCQPKQYAVSSKQYVIKNKNNATASAQAPFECPSWIPKNHWDAWIESRQKIRKPATDYAKRIAVTKLHYLNEEGHPPGQVLMQSTFNGWAGLFPVKEQK